MRNRIAFWTPVIAMIACATLVVSCTHNKRPDRPVGQISVQNFPALSESELATLLICNDTVGRDIRAQDPEKVSRCTVCMPYGLANSFESLRAHAHKLWMQTARAPYDSGGMPNKCVSLAFQRARALRPRHDSLLVERSLFEIAAAHDSVRRAALHSIDSALTSKPGDERGEEAMQLLEQFGKGVWDRAQRQLERPKALDVESVEWEAHQLAEVAPVFRALPKIPRTSRELGESEAMWSSQLFQMAAQRSTSSAGRARARRLALSPYVVLGRWAALDSVASVMLSESPRDSVVLTARALAAYRQMRRPAEESPRVSALFDEAVRAMPRVDSLRYDGFDWMLAPDDDKWRFEFLPDDRYWMDARGWSLVDPLWSTPVNEIQLARRARVAEADLRYADVARAGEAGSETKVGTMLLRLGPPDLRWLQTRPPAQGFFWFKRGWPEMTAVVRLFDLPPEVKGLLSPQVWKVFYGTTYSLNRLPSFPLSSDVRCETSQWVVLPTLYDCTTSRPPAWKGVPFYRTTSEIDVTLARFRAPPDSADVYVGARIPLATFKSRGDDGAKASDRIRIGLWFATPRGTITYHVDSQLPLPARNVRAWTQQWSHRVGSPALMHRVEAFESTKPSGARGAANFTTDEGANFPLLGFGMSDVLVAATLAPQGARRWRELNVVPNGASIAVGERFAMAWEIYDLVPGPDGRVHWRVRIRRERGTQVSQNDMKRVIDGSIAAGTRVIASESDAPDLSYTRDGDAAAVVLDQLAFSLRDAPVGRHVINVTVEDLVSGKSVTRGVSVRVFSPSDERRR